MQLHNISCYETVSEIVKQVFYVVNSLCKYSLLSNNTVPSLEEMDKILTAQSPIYKHVTSFLVAYTQFLN